jgi:hypothetical protein
MPRVPKWWPPEAKHWIRTGVLVAVATLVVTVLLNWPASEEPEAEPTNGPTSPTSTSPTPTTPTSTPSDPPPPPPSPEPVGIGIWDLEVVDYQLCARPNFGGANWNQEAVALGGDLLQDSQWCPLDHPSESGYLEYLVPDGSTELNGLVGITDDSPNTEAVVLFEVLSVDNGQVLWEGEAGFGAPVELRVALTDDTSRVRLQASVADFPSTDRGPAAYASFAGMVFE